MRKPVTLEAGKEKGRCGAPTGSLTGGRHRAWGALLRSHAFWVERIERRLSEAGVLGVEAYDVLLALSYAPNCRLRMGELHDVVTLSRSGLTRLVDRLEREGWVRREVCCNDRRSFEAILTDEGEAERARAWPIYAQAVAEEFGHFFSDDEARELAALLGRPLSHSAECGIRKP